jgi:hypothetical protein
MYIPGSGQNINDNAKAFIDQVFRPMARELIRYLRRVGEENAEEPVPAADRVVSLDHNSPKYEEAENALVALERALTETNDYADVEEKEQRVAEVSAARRLLKAIRVRIEPLVALLKPLVAQYGTKLKDNLVGIAVTVTVSALISLRAMDRNKSNCIPRRSSFSVGHCNLGAPGCGPRPCNGLFGYIFAHIPG